MTLSEIAAGLEVTTEQRDRGVATVDQTDKPLEDRLATFTDELPCSPSEAATVVEAYARGTSVGNAGREAGVPPVTAAKTLHLLGVEGVCPLSPQGRELVRDWLAARLSRSEARELSGASETAFQLAAFIETHDPIGEAHELVEPALGPGGNATVEKRDLLRETMSDADELL